MKKKMDKQKKIKIKIKQEERKKKNQTYLGVRNTRHGIGRVPELARGKERDGDIPILKSKISNVFSSKKKITRKVHY